MFCFNFGIAVAKICNKYKKISPEKSFWKLLSFVFSAKTTVGLIIVQRTVILAGGTKLMSFQKLFLWDIFLHLLNIFATAAAKLTQKISKIILQF